MTLVCQKGCRAAPSLDTSFTPSKLTRQFALQRNVFFAHSIPEPYMNTPSSLKRRDVLRSSLYAGAALTMPTWSKAAGANGDVRVAVIGFHGRGAGHIKSLQEIPGVRIVALCDVDNNVLQKGVADQAKSNNTV